jgi:hypothetical protein
MVRTIHVLSVIVFTIGCGGGQLGTAPPPPPPIDRVGAVEVRAWPKANTHELLQRTADKPAHVIVAVIDPHEPAVAWVTSDGTDLRAVYCVSPEDLASARARVAGQREAPIQGFIELGIKPGLVTRLCQPGVPHPEGGAPPLPPPPPPTSSDKPIKTVPCKGDGAACNYVILNPGHEGPPGEPPDPDRVILQRFDLQLQRLRAYAPQIIRTTSPR